MSLQPKVACFLFQEINFDELFGLFRASLIAIFLPTEQSNLYKMQGMQMYQIAFDICNSWPDSHAEQMLQGLLDFLDETTFVIQNVRNMTVIQDIKKEPDIVCTYGKLWLNFRMASDFTNRVCDCLNRFTKQQLIHYKSHEAQRIAQMTVEGHAYLIWKRVILLHFKEVHSDKLITQILDFLRHDRDGELREKVFLKDSIQSFIDLNVFESNPLQLYTEEFEIRFLQDTREYYSRESGIKIKELDISDFMSTAMFRLEQEKIRMDRYCPQSCVKALQVFHELYIANHREIIEDNFNDMIHEENIADCRMAHKLLLKLPNGTRNIVIVFEKYAAECVNLALMNISAEVSSGNQTIYLETLIKMQSNMTNISKSMFDNDPIFDAAIDKAFRLVINRPEITIAAENFAKYCDYLLKKNIKSKIDEEDIKEKVGKAVRL